MRWFKLGECDNNNEHTGVMTGEKTQIDIFLTHMFVFMIYMTPCDSIMEKKMIYAINVISH